MKTPTNYLRTTLGLVLALLGVTASFIAQAVCQGAPCPGQYAAAQAGAANWIATGSLNVARSGHTATLLPNGKVLVAGGRGNSTTPLASAELYDPASRTWNLTVSMSAPRVLHTATLLSSGKVLVVGGDTSTSPPTFGRANTAELYDPAAGTWTRTGNLNAASSLNTATLLQNGHGLFVEVLSDNRFHAAWFAFNPAGTQQAWFTGVGTYSGNTATITSVEQPTGGRWIPNFDPNQVVRNAWGTLTFTFTDCDHGRVDFNSVAGYGSGSMDLTRLTQPAGLTCP